MPKFVNHRAPLIALFVLFLASLACAAPGDTIVKGEVTCTYNPSIVNSYECTCPLGGSSQRYGASDLQAMDNDTLYRDVCQDALLVQPSQATRTATVTTVPFTQTATATATLTQAPVVLKPYLTGGFTTCNNVTGYVNFTIAADAPAYNAATFKVLFNGQAAKCTPAGNNSTVFTCNYPPAPYSPPATVEVFIGEERVNKFEFAGGAICNSATPTKRPNQDKPIPTATTD